MFTRLGSLHPPKPIGWALLLPFLFVGGETQAQSGEVTNSGSHSSKWQETGPPPAPHCVAEGQREAWTCGLHFGGPRLCLPLQNRCLACPLSSPLTSRLFPYVEQAGLGGAEVSPPTGSQQREGHLPPAPTLSPSCFLALKRPQHTCPRCSALRTHAPPSTSPRSAE